CRVRLAPRLPRQRAPLRAPARGGPVVVARRHRRRHPPAGGRGHRPRPAPPHAPQVSPRTRLTGRPGPGGTGPATAGVHDLGGGRLIHWNGTVTGPTRC